MADVLDPRTGAVDRPLDNCSPEELAKVVARVRAAQPSWEALGVEGRSTALTCLAIELEASAEALTAALRADTGRNIESVMEVAQVAQTARRWAGAAPHELRSMSINSTAMPEIELRALARPYGVVGVISPWNFPLLLGLIDAIPALAAGCAVVIKPSEVTPRFIAPLRAALAKVPALNSVVAVLEGDGSVGAELIRHVDAVCFTGSVSTGRRVAIAAATQFIPAFLELGGKDPAIVLNGADLDRATSALLWGATANAGQSCLSIERIYVDRRHHDEFVQLLVSKAARAGLAWPDIDKGVIGPLIDREQADIIERHLADAVAKGAKVHTGGQVEDHGGGRWVRPTVLTGVSHQMAVMTEETFGPVLPVMAFDTVDEALALANDSEFGLSGAVFGPDTESAAWVASRMAVGAVSINDAGLTAFVHEGEKNSFRLSGMGGSRMGPAAIRRFVRRQALIVNHGNRPQPWWSVT